MFKPIEIENVIEKDYQKQILDVVTDITFDWHFMEDTTFEKTDTLNKSTPSFVILKLTSLLIDNLFHSLSKIYL